MPDRPRVFVVKPQLTLASLISPLAKVPQLVVKGEKFNPAIRKSRIGGSRSTDLPLSFLLVPPASQRYYRVPPHDYVATMTAGPVPLLIVEEA